MELCGNYSRVPCLHALPLVNPEPSMQVCGRFQGTHVTCSSLAGALSPSNLRYLRVILRRAGVGGHLRLQLSRHLHGSYNLAWSHFNPH